MFAQTEDKLTISAKHYLSHKYVYMYIHVYVLVEWYTLMASGSSKASYMYVCA